VIGEFMSEAKAQKNKHERREPEILGEDRRKTKKKGGLRG